MSVALPGTGVSRGLATGRVRLLHSGQLEILEYALPRARIEEEISRFHKALTAAREQLHSLRRRIPDDTPDEIAAFVDTHLLMLEDATLAAAPAEIIRLRACNAEWALKLQQDALEKVFDAMDDPYLRTRRDDVAHVVQRVQRVLLADEYRPPLQAEDGEPLIIVAADISPSELLQLNQQAVAAIVTERGGPLAHTAILARNLGIPAICGVHHVYQYLREDEVVVVDGDQGVVLADLDAPALAYYRRLQRLQRRARAGLRRLKDAPAVTRDGVPIGMFANIDLPGDLAAVRRVGADGVGLFRTEFLFMRRTHLPDETEQYRIYRDAVRRLKGLPLTLRTLDLGADKTLGTEISSAVSPLGLRAIRFCLKEIHLFRTQLRAALRASAHGPVRLLIPMLTTVHEVFQVRQLLRRYMAELEAEGHAFDPEIPVGGMIEVPAAALCADSMSRGLDFFSIGTNDLIQYTLAADRIDDAVHHLYDPLNPAVLKLLLMTIEAGRRAGIGVAMCGEMAGDARFTRLLLGMGLTELSMPAATLLEVKERIGGSDFGKLRNRVRALLRQQDPARLAESLERLNRD